MQLVVPPDTWDIREPAAVERLVAAQELDIILHLAAQSYVPHSFIDPRLTFDVNLMGTLNLLVALKRSGFDGRLLYVSSADVYGRVSDAELPIDEGTPARPVSPYASSKLAAEQLCLQWCRSESLDVVIARPFNHIGPGQHEKFVVPALARQVVNIALGKQPPVIETGDLDTTRDFTDIRDVVAAYADLILTGKSGQTYVIATGIERRIRDILGVMCEKMCIAPEVRQEASRMRPGEQRRIAGNATKLRKETGWQPAHSFAQSIGDVLQEVIRNHEQ
ncbi:MAG: GDP-mannose 4,6-dehydratase [Steroidobacteraceae bacterium]|nr:GDP-mannose 4,6-dehydratase [Steroidobacteraceae bacterium]